MDQQESIIELYEDKYFLGRKLVLREEASCLMAYNFNDICSSIKVKGPGSWYVYESVNYEGWYLTLSTGEYPDLSKYNAKDDAISSVKPAWTGEPPKPPKAQGDIYAKPWQAVGVWFLGTHAENQDLFNDLAIEAFNFHREYRQSYFPMDKKLINEDIKTSGPYLTEVKQLKQELRKICTDLQQSVPFPSQRYQGHMNWDVSMAATLGYLSALLYNQNNCAAEGSPVTTRMEIEVAEHMCEMIGYNTIDHQDPLIPTAWGHITSGGTTANLEALWSSRNAKFFPLAMQRALLEEPELHAATAYEVMVPRFGLKKQLVDLSQWDLLNLDIDDIIRIPDEVQVLSGVEETQFSRILKKYNLESLGLVGFQQMHKYREPVVFSPSSSHYSWLKAMTVLGLGDAQLIRVPLDEYVRQNVQDLQLALEDCLSKQVPVIAVVVVMGTTAEGAVDPAYEILELRKKLRLRGLNFAVLADAAWGGYFLTMLTQSRLQDTQKAEEGNFILPLNPNTKKQLLHMRYCDTVTLDPHKTGFIPYPAGGLCYRNGKMKRFVTITSAYVYHGGKDDSSVGLFGIAGSTPGASAASCLLSHRAIGLDQHGYGRILSQVMFGAKLYYCMWMTVAKDNDPFVCVNLIPLQTNWPVERAKKFIREKILGKDTWEVAKDIEVLDFLTENGSDLLINTFTINLKNNKDLNLLTRLNVAIYEHLSLGNVASKDVKRVPLILTKSEMSPGYRQHHFRQRLGLNCASDADKDLIYLINTVMSPWQTSIAWIENVGQIFRNCVLNCIGEVTDIATLHKFVVINTVSTDNEVFAVYLPSFTDKASQYHVVAKMKFADPKIACKFRQMQESQLFKPLFLQSVKPATVHDLMYKCRSDGFCVEVFDAYPLQDSIPILEVMASVYVTDVPKFQHFDMAAERYPEHMTYWLFGDAHGAYLSHVITKQPDFLQVVKLDRIPHSVSMELLDLGIPIYIKSMPGDPLIIDGEIIDPLQRHEYAVQFTGEGGIDMKTIISLAASKAKVVFDYEHLAA